MRGHNPLLYYTKGADDLMTNTESKVRGVKLKLHCAIMKLNNLPGLLRVMEVVHKEMNYQAIETDLFNGHQHPEHLTKKEGQRNEKTPQT